MFQSYYKKWIGLIVYPFLVFTLPYSSLAQNEPLNEAYKSALDLNFDQSRKLIDQAASQGLPYFDLYLGNLNDVLELVFTEDETRYELLNKHEEQRLSLLSDKAKSPYKGFFKAEIKLQWAFVKLKFGDTWSGVWSLRKAYKIIEDNIESYPDFDLNYKTMGLLHVIFGAVPEEQQWILQILGLEGNVEQGLNELKTLETQPGTFQIETKLIVALIQSYLLEQNEQALASLSAVSNESTLVQTYVSALVLMKAHHAEKAKELLQQALNGSASTKNISPLFHYLLAEAQFQGANYAQAKTNYLYFIQHFKGTGQLKDAQMKVALCEHFQGNNLRFKTGWKLAKNIQQVSTEADRNAKKILENEDTNFSLLQIRYAIDGGFYTLADSLITTMPQPLSLKEEIELDYRKARLAQLIGQSSEALEYFKQVITNKEKDSDAYFVPNSFLQMGYLYLSNGDRAKAERAFEEVLRFKKHPYKNSLDSKAKIALEALNGSGG